MTRLFLAAGVAALAIAAPATAERGGKADNKRQSAKVERSGGGGSARAERKANRSERAERRGGQRLAQADRGKARSEARAERRQKVVRDRSDGRRTAKIENRTRVDRKDMRAQRVAGRLDRRNQRVENFAEFREEQLARRIAMPNRSLRVGEFGRGRGLIDGCPPGLVDKNELCMAPGQYKKRMLGEVLPATFSQRLIPQGLRDVYRDTDDFYYRMGNGYVYRVDRDTNLIAALLPLLGGGLGVGQLYPTSFGNSLMPNYFQSFYPNTDDDYYRYANGYVYEIDRSSGLIEDIIPMYANGYGVGQMLPASYSYYNVPSQYRSFYPNSSSQLYRYAPGAIYQVDPASNLITGIASLLAGDLAVGQPLPMAYSAYNVPLAYRSQYFDTPNSLYRYNDGYIYQVDPTTRLITAVINAIV